MSARGRAVTHGLTLLRILADGRIHELRQLAVELHLSPRSVRRYIAALQSAGIPIGPIRSRRAEDVSAVSAWHLDQGDVVAWFNERRVE